MRSRPLNLMAMPDYGVPYFNAWNTNFRSVTTDDVDPLDIPAGERISLVNVPGYNASGARFHNNEIQLLVQGPAGTKVKLYAIEPTADDGTTPVAFFFEERTTTVENQRIRFDNLPALVYVPHISSVVGTVKLHGGGTR